MSTSAMRAWRIDLILILGLLLAGSLLYFTQITRLSTSDYHGDEGPWALAGDYYFRAYFLEGDWSYARWDEPRYGPWSGDSPVVGKYIIGAALWLTGPSPRDLTPQPPYNYAESFEWNLANGTTPPPEVIIAARRGIALAAILASVALYLLARRLTASRAVAGVAGLLFLLDPLTMFAGQRVLIDMPALLFSLLALWAGHHWLSARHARGVFGWGALTGLLLALALSSKMNALYVIAVLLAWLAVLMLWSPRARRPAARWLWGSLLLMLGIAAGLTVLLNPLLHQRTLENVGRLIAHGRAVANYDVPDPFRLETLDERVANLVVTGLVESGTAFRLADPAAWPCGQRLGCVPKPAILGRPFPGGWLSARPWIDALLALAGVAFIVLQVVWPRAPLALRRDALLVLLWAGAAAGSIVLTIPFAWERWYLPMEPLWALFQAVAIVVPFQWLAGRWRGRRGATKNATPQGRWRGSEREAVSSGRRAPVAWRVEPMTRPSTGKGAASRRRAVRWLPKAPRGGWPRCAEPARQRCPPRPLPAGSSRRRTHP